MLENFLFNQTSLELRMKAMDAYALRMKATANNVANVGTMKYERKAVNFEKKLDEILNGVALAGSRTDSNHMALGRDRLEDLTPEVETPEDDFFNGVNNVDIDHEMMEMGKVQIQTAFIARSISGLFGSIEAGIKGQSSR